MSLGQEKNYSEKQYGKNAESIVDFYFGVTVLEAIVLVQSFCQRQVDQSYFHFFLCFLLLYIRSVFGSRLHVSSVLVEPGHWCQTYERQTKKKELYGLTFEGQSAEASITHSGWSAPPDIHPTIKRIRRITRFDDSSINSVTPHESSASTYKTVVI